MKKRIGSVGEGEIVKIDDPEAKVVCYAVGGKYSSNGGGTGTAIACLSRP